MDSYRINEIFYSLQGEGYYTGTPAVFLRMSGCNLKCGFCDTSHESHTIMTIDEIIDAVTDFPARHIVITGGEPTLQLDAALTTRLKEEGFYIQIETNGTHPVAPAVDWVTVSPKGAPLAINKADELKIVFTGQDVETIAETVEACHLFLQPCSGMNIPETVQYIKGHPWWRLSLQTHKLIDIP